MSETLDIKDNAANLASHILSLNLEAHEISKTLEGTRLAVADLASQLTGDAQKLATEVQDELLECQCWASVCLEMGRFIRACRQEPELAARRFRKKRVEEGTWCTCDVSEVVTRAIQKCRRLEEAAKTQIRTHLARPTCVMGDKDVLYSAIKNLLQNALTHATRQATPGRAVYRYGVPVACEVRLDPASRQVVIDVRDEGVGMDDATLAAAREVYADPASIGRTAVCPGFGTAVVAFAVDVHGGCVDIDSAIGKGTSIRIVLPMLTEEVVSCEKLS